MVIASHKNFLVFFSFGSVVVFAWLQDESKNKNGTERIHAHEMEKEWERWKKTEFEKRKQTIERKQSSRFAKSNFAYT